MINAVPDFVEINKRESHNRQKCQGCFSVVNRDNNDSDWVVCPLFSKGLICYGCCLDMQGLARSLEFHEDPYLDLFEDIAKGQKETVNDLRRTCLGHQFEVASKNILTDAEDEKDLKILIQYLKVTIEEIDSV